VTEYGRHGHLPDEAARQLACLARYVCGLEDGLPARRKFLDKMCKRRPAAYGLKLRAAVSEEWRRRNPL
jgi:hypothetical protein